MGQAEMKAIGEGLRHDMRDRQAEAKVDTKTIGDRLDAMGKKMDEGLAEVKADMRAMSDDMALKFQAVWDEVNRVRGVWTVSGKR